VDLERHGREDIFDGLDVSRTVGWFTVLFPVFIDLSAVSHPGETLKSVKEQLRRAPNRGIGYGVLRYIGDDDSAARLKACRKAEVSFNYLGQFDQFVPPSSPLSLVPASGGLTASPRGSRPYLIEVNGVIVRGQLHLMWTYSTSMHRRSTIEDVARECTDALRALIAHCLSPDAGGYTPSDFPAAGLSQQELDEILAEVGDTLDGG
jgi:non-ribosomal peptide synthase protein (TIGR01720 family)